MESIFFYDTIIGKIGIVDSKNAISALYFMGKKLPADIRIGETAILKEAGRQLQQYFTGERRFFDLPLAPAGTEFQQRVWQALQTIPYGETRSYKQVAEAIRQPKACRAVGMANHKNPIPIFIPCHRVIGTNGKLVGYAGGLDKKDLLLNLEKGLGMFRRFEIVNKTSKEESAC